MDIGTILSPNAAMQDANVPPSSHPAPAPASVALSVPASAKPDQKGDKVGATDPVAPSAPLPTPYVLAMESFAQYAHLHAARAESSHPTVREEIDATKKLPLLEAKLRKDADVRVEAMQADIGRDMKSTSEDLKRIEQHQRASQRTVLRKARRVRTKAAASSAGETHGEGAAMTRPSPSPSVRPQGDGKDGVAVRSEPPVSADADVLKTALLNRLVLLERERQHVGPKIREDVARLIERAREDVKYEVHVRNQSMRAREITHWAEIRARRGIDTKEEAVSSTAASATPSSSTTLAKVLFPRGLHISLGSTTDRDSANEKADEPRPILKDVSAPAEGVVRIEYFTNRDDGAESTQLPLHDRGGLDAKEAQTVLFGTVSAGEAYDALCFLVAYYQLACAWCQDPGVQRDGEPPSMGMARMTEEIMLKFAAAAFRCALRYDLPTELPASEWLGRLEARCLVVITALESNGFVVEEKTFVSDVFDSAVSRPRKDWVQPETPAAKSVYELLYRIGGPLLRVLMHSRERRPLADVSDEKGAAMFVWCPRLLDDQPTILFGEFIWFLFGNNDPAMEFTPETQRLRAKLFLESGLHVIGVDQWIWDGQFMFQASAYAMRATALLHGQLISAKDAATLVATDRYRWASDFRTSTFVEDIALSEIAQRYLMRNGNQPFPIRCFVLHMQVLVPSPPGIPRTGTEAEKKAAYEARNRHELEINALHAHCANQIIRSTAKALERSESVSTHRKMEEMDAARYRALLEGYDPTTVDWMPASRPRFVDQGWGPSQPAPEMSPPEGWAALFQGKCTPSEAIGTELKWLTTRPTGSTVRAQSLQLLARMRFAWTQVKGTDSAIQGALGTLARETLCGKMLDEVLSNKATLSAAQVPLVQDALRVWTAQSVRNAGWRA